jgi:hypothetical protein
MRSSPTSGAQRLHRGRRHIYTVEDPHVLTLACEAKARRPALWVDPAAHANECRRFDSYVVKGPGPDDKQSRRVMNYAALQRNS